MANNMYSGDTQSLSELRIMLMGYKGAGKSSAGNIILNREEFDLKRTAQCVKRQRETSDRLITVIEAPGWWINEPVDYSTKLLKQEILLSVSLCPPGPHAVLLLIRADIKFGEYERKVYEGYVDLLGERVWSHTVVLFTHGDFLGDTSIEQHIEREGEDLQRLVEKCGNRYHVLNNKNSSDETQIKDLLEKIEETVTQNNGCHYEIDRKILQEMEERRRAKEERARLQGRQSTYNASGLASVSVFHTGSPKVYVPARMCHSMFGGKPTMSAEGMNTVPLTITDRFMSGGSVSSVSSGYGSSLSLPESVEDLQKNV